MVYLVMPFGNSSIGKPTIVGLSWHTEFSFLLSLDCLLNSLASNPIGRSMHNTSGMDGVECFSTPSTIDEPSSLNKYCECGFQFSALRIHTVGDFGSPFRKFSIADKPSALLTKLLSDCILFVRWSGLYKVTCPLDRLDNRGRRLTKKNSQ